MDWKKRWTALAEFLGQALGSDYEIAVHDFTGEEPRLLALVNPQVSGRAQNAPPSNLALDFWRSRTFEGSDGRTGYRGISASGMPTPVSATSSTTRPSRTRGETVFRMASGCSKISLSIKWG